jgi:hypothetical protein
MGDMQGASPEQLARLMQMLEARKQAEQEEFTGGAQPMPEEQGIGRLPAGNMDFAGGGIIAFADGGDVERYSGETGSLVGESLDEAKARVAAAQQKLYSYGLRQRQQDPSGFEMAQQNLAAAQAQAQAASKKYEAEMAGSGASRASFGAPTAQTTVALPRPPEAKPTSAPSAQDMAQFDAASDRYMAERASAQSAEKAPIERTTKANANTTEPRSYLSGISGIDALQQKYFGGFEGRANNINAKRQGLVQGIKDLTAANLADTEADAAARSSDVVYKGREARLAKQEKDIEGMGDKYLGLALLQAGAAMMSTPGGLAAAIGKGAVVGAERYAAGLEKINAAQAKFAEARDRLDDLRLNRDDMNAKEVRAAKREYKAADLRGQELLLSGAEKDWGIERDMLGKLFTAASDDLQTTRRIQAQKETAGKQDTNEKMRASVFAELQAKYPNDPAKVATEFNKTIAKSAADPMALYNQELAKAIAEEEVKLAKMGDAVMPGQREKLQALKNQLAGGGAGKPPEAGKVPSPPPGFKLN